MRVGADATLIVQHPKRYLTDGTALAANLDVGEAGGLKACDGGTVFGHSSAAVLASGRAIRRRLWRIDGPDLSCGRRTDAGDAPMALRLRLPAELGPKIGEPAAES